jgi:hypothetical protein
MALTDVFWPWTHAFDLHLLPGTTSPRLDQLLWTNDTRGTKRADAPHPGTTVSFKAQFDGAPARHGVTMNATTGQITVANPLPAGPRLRSFLVDGSAKEGATTVTARVRVHVHDGLTRIWLTPAPLTARRDAKDIRLSILAQFTDGVIGDITNWCPFNPIAAGEQTFVSDTGTPGPKVVWSTSNAATIGVDADTGVLDANTNVGNVTVTASLRPLPPAAGRFATARVDAAPAWTTPVRLTHLGGPGFAAMNTATNILILPDGFQAADRAGFEALARNIVSQLTLHQKTRPFDLLAGRLNYFMAWLPSRDAGVTVQDECDRVSPAGATWQGRPMELPSRLGGPVGRWALEDLINEVGPPTPVHDPPGSPLGTAAAGRLHDWQAVYGLHITAPRMSFLYADWLDRSDRVLLNERDTALHVAMGDRPRTDGRGSVERALVMNQRRLAQSDFDAFLDALQDAGGGAVPNVWSSGGKDDDLVVVLCRTQRHSGANAGRGDGHTLAVGLGGNTTHTITANPLGNGFDLVADPVPRRIHPETWINVAHELAHSWTLNDEYGGAGALTPDQVADIAKRTNTQPRSALLNGAGQLVTTNLKWRWPRIAKAAQLTGNPVALGGGSYRIPVVAGQGRAFAVGDIVRLRTRPLLTAATPSVRFRVTAVAANDVTSQILAGGVVNTATYPAGSIVMAPVRAPDTAPGVLGNDLELVAASVRTRIDATHNALNAAHTDAVNRACVPGGIDLFKPTKARNFPAGRAPKPPRYSSWIVGVFENGAGIDCAVLRPTGVCLMGILSFTDPRSRSTKAYQFCHVCRYAMVDLLDPSQHGAIDADFAARYPT